MKWDEIKLIKDNEALEIGTVYVLTDYSFEIPLIPINKSTFKDVIILDNGIIIEYDFDNNTIYSFYDRERNIFSQSNIIDNWYIDNSTHDIIIGVNSNGNIQNSSFVTIGDNNTDIQIENAIGVRIGNNNTDVLIGNKSIQTKDVHIHDNNNIVTISGHYNIVGSNNLSIVTKGDNNNLLNNNTNVTISDFNVVDTSEHISIVGGVNNEIIGSSSVQISDGIGNKIDCSSMVKLENTNTNKLYVDNLELISQDFNVEIYTLNGQKIVKGTNEIIDAKGNKRNPNSNEEPKKETNNYEYYIDPETKLWTKKEIIED